MIFDVKFMRTTYNMHTEIQQHVLHHTIKNFECESKVLIAQFGPMTLLG